MFLDDDNCRMTACLLASDWDAASPPRYVVAIVAVVVPEGLEPPPSRGDRAPEGNARWCKQDTRGTGSSGQADNTETWEETKDKMLHINTGRTLETAKDFEPNLQEECRSQYEGV